MNGTDDKILQLQQENEELRESIVKMQQVLRVGNMSMLEEQISQYKDESMTHLKRIVSELLVSDFGHAECEEILGLIEYLDYVRSELYSFVAIRHQGKQLGMPCLQGCELELKELFQLIRSPEVLARVPEEKLDDLHETLLSVNEILRCYLEEGAAS